jgi:anaerobic magnesium-protoporphyrin IX monomethyl ester cyclase
MKVALVICNVHLEHYRFGRQRQRWESTYREGLACIAGLLVRNGHEVRLLKVEAGLGDAAFLKLYASHFADCDLVGFSANTVDFPEATRLAQLLKGCGHRAFTVCGGVHTTLAPEESSRAPGFDAIGVGEGEEAMLELCGQLAAGRRPSGIAGLWIRGPAGFDKGPVRPLITDLTRYPPARGLPTVTSYDPKSISDVDFFMATRGCPYACTYCCNDALRCVYPNGREYYRLKPVDQVIAELKEHLARGSRGHIPFYDDVMMADSAWFEEFAARYEEEIHQRCFFTARWELLTEKTVLLLKRLRTLFLLVGVEVGDEELRRGVLGRNQSTQLMLERAALLRRHRVRFGLYTMVGVPTENVERALATVKLAARLRGNPVLGHHTIFFPFAGTPLHAQCEREGLISQRLVGSYFYDTRLDMPGFTREEILSAHQSFQSFQIAYRLAFAMPGGLARRAERWLDRRWHRKVGRAGPPRTPAPAPLP